MLVTGIRPIDPSEEGDESATKVNQSTDRGNQIIVNVKFELMY